MSINKVILVGHLGQDPETRSFPSGGQVTNATLATNEKWKDRQSGEQREHTEWHRLVFGGKLAGIAAQHLRKGSQVYVEGKLRTRKWQGQDGQDRYTTEVRVDTMRMLGGNPGVAPTAPRPAPARQPAPAPAQGGFVDMDDEIPF